MSRRRQQQQQIVEGDLAPHMMYSRYPQEGGSIRLSLIIAIVLLGLAIIGASILGIMSLSDVIRGHTGETWQHFTAMWDTLKWWLIVGGIGSVVVFKVILPVYTLHTQTAVERAEAAVKRAEAKRIREQTFMALDVHDHNLEHLPSAYLITPDVYGNYPQMIGPDGRIVSLLLPGNAGESVNSTGVSPQFLRDWMEAQMMVQGQVEEGVPLIEGPDPIDPRTVEAATLEQEVASGQVVEGNPVTMGYKVIIDEFTGQATLEPIEDPDKTSIFIVGGSTCGKSTLVSTLLARMAARGDTVFIVIDPHKNNKDKSICAKILPALEPWLAYPVVGNDAKEIKKVVRFINDLIALRFSENEAAKRRHPLFGLKVRVIIDEALLLAMNTRMQGHDPAYDELLFCMQAMAVGSAKEEVMFIAMAQVARKQDLGDIEIRDVCPTNIVLKTPYQSALALRLTSEQANSCNFFPRGRGFITLSDGGYPELFIWGYGSAESIARLASTLTSPLQTQRKIERNNIVNLHPVVVSENSYQSDFEEEKIGINQIEKQFPQALRADLDRIPQWDEKMRQLEEMIGQEMGVIIRTIWNATPGPGEKYKTARAEYDVLSEAIRVKLQMRREA